MLTARRLAALLLCAGLLGATPADPDAAYAAARDAFSVVTYPRYAHYQIVVRYTLGTKAMTRTWSEFEDLQRRTVHAHAFSAEETARPHVPHGTNIGFGIGPSGVQPVDPLARPVTPHTQEREDDPIGLVTFAVNQDFGLQRDAPPIAAVQSATDVEGPTTALRRIGRTGVQAKAYDVTALGSEVENGKTLVHLGLRPLHDPQRFRLRELWLDAGSALPVRAIVAGVGNRWPLDSVRWRIDYALVDGAPYIVRETALETLGSDRGDLTDATIAFVGVQTMHIPDVYDRIGYSGEVGTTDP